MTNISIPEDGKSAVQSKTMIVNALAPILSWALTLAGLAVPVEVQVAVLAIINVVLRMVTTKKISGVI
jgi:hypothetical protein